MAVGVDGLMMLMRGVRRLFSEDDGLCSQSVGESPEADDEQAEVTGVVDVVKLPL